MSALRATGLSCGYGQKAILSDLDLEVPPGNFVCIIGANGVGKSTLVHTLAGLLPSLGGTVSAGDEVMSDWSPAQRARNLSVVLTRMPAIGYLTVRRFVEIGRHPYTGTLGRLTEEDIRVVDGALERVGVAHLAHRFLGEISDGERQRAAIARAFAQSASLMILDEPTAFLDVESRAVVMKTLRDLAHQTGGSVLATSHDIELVLRISDLIWMIEPGGTIRTGAPEDIVLSGGLTHVFPRHVMEFDMDAGVFRLPRPEGGEVTVIGTGDRAAWTVRAIERIGLRAEAHPGNGRDPNPVTGRTTVETGPGPDPVWTVRRRDEEFSCHTIAELVTFLQGLPAGR